MRLAIDTAFRLTNGGGKRQRNNQQGEDHAEGDVEAPEQRSDEGTADAADTKTQINHTIVFRQVVQTEEFTDQRWEDGDGSAEVKSNAGDGGEKVMAFSGANSSAAIPTSDTT